MRCKQSFDLINYLVRMLSACWLICLWFAVMHMQVLRYYKKSIWWREQSHTVARFVTSNIRVKGHRQNSGLFQLKLDFGKYSSA